MAAFYSPTLNFLYVCALVVYFLMNTWLCNESHCTRFVGLTSQACEGSAVRYCSGTGFVCLYFGRAVGEVTEKVGQC